MTFKKLSIATARINGLRNPPYLCTERCSYYLDITFSDTSTLAFNNLSGIKAGNTHEEAKIFHRQVKEHFKTAHINEGDQIAVIFDNSGNVIAISRAGQELWIDVTDKFRVRGFKELGIYPSSLKVY